MQSLPISPYRSILSFGNTGKPENSPSHLQHFYWIDNQQYMLLSTEKSYKIISLPEFKTKFMGPTFKENIRGITCYNEHVFVAFEKKVSKLHLFHLLDEIKFEGSEKVNCVRIFGKILLVGMDGWLGIYESDSLKLVRRIDVGFQVKMLEHPLAYKNKVLVSDGQHVMLINVNTGKKLFSFQDESSIFQILKSVSISVFIPMKK